MKRIIFSVFLSALCVSLVGFKGFASEDIPVSMTLTPEHYVSVKGDVGKFRAHNWMSDGYSGGIKELLINYDEDATSVDFDGHFFYEENDNGANLAIANEKWGGINLEYDSFRKYYDNSGVFYHPFTPAFQTNDLSQDLYVDMENFSLAFMPGLEIPGIHDLTFSFDRHHKDGIKSRLTWTSVVGSSATRGIGPVWQDIKETAETFTIEGKTELAGFDVKGKQIFETSKIQSLRQEEYLSINTSGATASQRKIRSQYQNPNSDMMATLVSGEKWFDDDTSFLALAYSFHKLDNDELENIIERDENGTPTNYGGNAKTRINAYAQNEYTSHTLLNNYVKQISKSLNISVKLRGENIKKEGQSAYPYDTNATPDGIIDDVDLSDSDNKLWRFGQDIGFRYNGIAKNSFYGNVEFQQVENKLREQQYDEDGSLIWARKTNGSFLTTSYTLGNRYVPTKKLNVATQVRYKDERNDYNNKEIITSGYSGFMDELKREKMEASTRLSYKLIDDVQLGFRYQMFQEKYTARVTGELEQEARTVSHIFTYDILMTPIENLLMNLSFSRQDINIATAAAATGASPNIPGFNGDVNTVLFGGSYALDETKSFTTSAAYSWSDNFNDFASTAMPLAVSNRMYNIDVGMSFKPKKTDVVIEPHYAYYNYEGDALSEFGNYSAHVAWVDLSFLW